MNAYIYFYHVCNHNQPTHTHLTQTATEFHSAAQLTWAYSLGYFDFELSVLLWLLPLSAGITDI